jgi:hypothetical protein
MFDVIFGEFLGIETRRIAEDRNDVCISYDDETTRVHIADSLFAAAEQDWLHARSLPLEPLQTYSLPGALTELMHAGSTNIPVLYGKPVAEGQYFTQRDNIIELGIDILGSAFFMLTRYEEVCSSDHDQFGRFPYSASISSRAGIHRRPLVNEYLEILWACLLRLWPEIKRKSQQYECLLSHDVDRLFDTREKSWPAVAKNALGDLAKRGDVGLAAKRVYSKAVSTAENYKYEPCSTFDFIMDCSEQHGLQSAFYFIACGSRDGRNGDYSIDMPWVRALIRQITSRNHELGLHGSYASFEQPDQITVEFSRLRSIAEEQCVSQTIWGGRQHYLRWATPTTWQSWEDAGLAYDSTLTFPEAPGFRSGTCFEYSVFNLHTREKLKLRERPLIVMEISLFSEAYSNLSQCEALERIVQLSAACRTFGGQFTLLWHNDNLITRSQKSLYRNVLDAIV